MSNWPRLDWPFSKKVHKKKSSLSWSACSMVFLYLPSSPLGQCRSRRWWYLAIFSPLSWTRPLPYQTPPPESARVPVGCRRNVVLLTRLPYLLWKINSSIRRLTLLDSAISTARQKYRFAAAWSWLTEKRLPAMHHVSGRCRARCKKFDERAIDKKFEGFQIPNRTW